MLSIMETSLALTLVNPAGSGSLRISKDDPAYLDIKRIARSDMPVEQAWETIQEFARDPFQALRVWLDGFGVPFLDRARRSGSQGTELLTLGSHDLPRDFWLDWLGKLKKCGGNPKHVITFLDKVSNTRPPMESFYLEQPLHIHGRFASVNLLGIQKLPEEARQGDLFNRRLSKGDFPFVVSYTDAYDERKSNSGFVLYKLTGDMARWQTDIMNQPMLLGFNRTYVCEEGSPEGWLETHSTDSLEEANQTVKEVRAAGYETRIVNRLTGEVIG